MPAEQPGPEQLLEAAIEAVACASRMCKDLQSRLLAGDAIDKADRSPVTIADFASQALVARALRQRLGRRLMVAEEDSQTLRRPESTALLGRVVEAVRTQWPGASEADVLEAVDAGCADPAELDAGGFWTLDPIDGTKGFLRGGQYAVSLAWIEGGAPTVAAMGCPNLSPDFSRPFDEPDPHGLLFAACAGKGAWRLRLGDPPGEREPVHRQGLPDASAPPNRPLRVCESVESGHTSSEDRQKVMALVGPTAPPARLDGQGKYAVVAQGQADAYLRLPRPGKRYVEKIWDHAAGDLIAREAGCVVSDIHGRPLDYSHGEVLAANEGIVCADPAIHGRIVEAIARVHGA